MSDKFPSGDEVVLSEQKKHSDQVNPAPIPNVRQPELLRLDTSTPPDISPVKEYWSFIKNIASNFLKLSSDIAEENLNLKISKATASYVLDRSEITNSILQIYGTDLYAEQFGDQDLFQAISSAVDKRKKEIFKDLNFRPAQQKFLLATNQLDSSFFPQIAGKINGYKASIIIKRIENSVADHQNAIVADPSSFSVQYEQIQSLINSSQIELIPIKQRLALISKIETNTLLCKGRGIIHDDAASPGTLLKRLKSDPDLKRLPPEYQAKLEKEANTAINTYNTQQLRLIKEQERQISDEQIQLGSELKAQALSGVDVSLPALEALHNNNISKKQYKTIIEKNAQVQTSYKIEQANHQRCSTLIAQGFALSPEDQEKYGLTMIADKMRNNGGAPLSITEQFEAIAPIISHKLPTFFINSLREGLYSNDPTKIKNTISVYNAIVARRPAAQKELFENDKMFETAMIKADLKYKRTQNLEEVNSVVQKLLENQISTGKPLIKYSSVEISKIADKIETELKEKLGTKRWFSSEIPSTTEIVIAKNELHNNVKELLQTGMHPDEIRPYIDSYINVNCRKNSEFSINKNDSYTYKPIETEFDAVVQDDSNFKNIISTSIIDKLESIKTPTPSSKDIELSKITGMPIIKEIITEGNVIKVLVSEDNGQSYSKKRIGLRYRFPGNYAVLYENTENASEPKNLLEKHSSVPLTVNVETIKSNLQKKPND